MAQCNDGNRGGKEVREKRQNAHLKRRRPLSVIDSLPDEIRREIDALIFGPCRPSYSEVIKNIKDKHEISIGIGALSAYYHRNQSVFFHVKRPRQVSFFLELPCSWVDIIRAHVGTSQAAFDQFVNESIMDRLKRERWKL